MIQSCVVSKDDGAVSTNTISKHSHMQLRVCVEEKLSVSLRNLCYLLVEYPINDTIIDK
jgi:hypothetical protein